MRKMKFQKKKPVEFETKDAIVGAIAVALIVLWIYLA
jgi:hypothetical protein